MKKSLIVSEKKMIGFIAKKVGMLRVYDSDGVLRGVTLLDLSGSELLGFRTKDRDGYEAMIVGFKDSKGKITKIKEFRLVEGEEKPENYSVELLKDIKFVDITGVSKGKGFAGVMKRYGFGGGPDSHGSTLFHRRPGSSGQHTFPGRVWKGKKMAGRMGGEKVTVKNLKVAFLDEGKGLLGVIGAVPGAKGSLVFIRPSYKNFIKK